MRDMVFASRIRALAAGIFVAAVFAAAAIGLSTLPSAADSNNNNDAPAIHVEMLLTDPDRAEFTDDVAVQIRNKFDGHGTNVINMSDASRIAVARITIEPKAVFPWHTHPGPVFITIAEGDFVYVLASDCVYREYSAGQALIDAGGDNVHTAYNPSGTDNTVVIATFLNAPAEGPLTVPVDGPDAEVCPLPAP
jgi:quercetin dioxygenase-like cupin family protein